MKTSTKKAWLAVIVALLLTASLAGCTKTETLEITSQSSKTTPPSSNNAQQTGSSIMEEPVIQRTSPAPVEYRNAEDEIERIAIGFVDSIYHMHGIHMNGWTADELLTSFVKPDSFYPIAPHSTSDEHIGMMLKAYCIRSYDRYLGRLRYGEIDGLSVLSYNAEGGAVGIVSTEPSEFVDGATSVEVAIQSILAGDIVTAWVEVARDEDGLYIAPILPTKWPHQSEPAEFDAPVVVSVPSGFGVEYRGLNATPVASDKDKDYYELEGFYRGVPEVLVIDMGVPFGRMRCIVFGDGSVWGGSTIGYRGYAGSTIVTDLMALSVTHSEFIGIRDDIVNSANSFVQRIGGFLTENDHEGFVALSSNPDAFRGASWTHCFRMWAREDAEYSFADAKREITINRIDILPRSAAHIWFSTLLTTPHGVQYTADSQLILVYTDGEWSIWNMTAELLKRDTNTWALVE